MMEHADGPAVLKRLCSRVFRDYTARCAARADVRGQECAADREWSMHADEVHCSAVREGTLVKARDGSDWTLMLVWHEKYGSRVLARGSREHVEHCAVDFAISMVRQGSPSSATSGPAGAASAETTRSTRSRSAAT